MEPAPESGWWSAIKSPFVWVGEKASSALSATRAAPVVSDTVAAKTLGAEPEAPGTTMTGGRRHRTRKARKGRKTRRGHRTH